MKIIYASCLMTEKKIEKTFNNITDYDGFQVQKFHKLLVEGFRLNKCKVDVITVLPVTKTNSSKRVYKGEVECEQGVTYHYPGIINIPVLKHIFAIMTSMFRFISIAKRNKDSVLIADCLNQSAALGCILGAKLMKVPSVGIVTDLPDLLLGKKDRIKNRIICMYDQYVLLTEQMNDYIVSKITHKDKPYIVVEGMVDIHMNKEVISEKDKYSKKVCMYSGILDRKYGIEMLVKGFDEAHISDSELHIYGDGDFREELLDICAKNSDIKYFGLKPNSYVVKEQQKVTLLVNPRPSNEEFTKYSFPSKNMEYMASGTPALLTRLPGIPEEYWSYAFFVENETEYGMLLRLREILNMSHRELTEKGFRAKRFVMENKNNKMQARKILEFVEKVHNANK